MIAQLLTNAIVAAAGYALVAVGFALIYNTVRFFHFAHGVVFTAGAYFAFLFRVWCGLSLVSSLLLAVALCVVLGSVMEIGIYRPLRHRNASGLTLLLASIGIYVVLQNLLSLVIGDDSKALYGGVVREGFNIVGARITGVQLATIAVSTSLLLLVAWFLKGSKVGKAMRALASDRTLAAVSGIDDDSITLKTFALGSALAGGAGVLVALDVSMTPTMGLDALMMGVVAVIIGGRNSVVGIALGALLLGMAQQLGAWRFGSEWQGMIAFAILLIFLLFRPEGFFGRQLRTSTV